MHWDLVLHVLKWNVAHIQYRQLRRKKCGMVEPMAVSIAGTVASKLLEQVMEATKNCHKLQQVLQGSSCLS